jgi:uncharacterized protein (TIGR03067 family)
MMRGCRSNFWEIIMRRMRWFCVWGTMLVVAGLVRGGGEGKNKLEGVWVADKDGKKVEMRFEKGAFTVTLAEKTVKGTYKTDTKKTPHELDILLKDDDPKIDGKTALCIYEVSGDTLKWMANDPGQGNPRPKAFPAEQRFGGEYIYLIFKRAGK